MLTIAASYCSPAVYNLYIPCFYYSYSIPMPKAFQELSRRQKNRRLCAYAREDSTDTSENKNSDTINANEKCNLTKSYEELSVVPDDETIHDVNDYNILPEEKWIDEEDDYICIVETVMKNSEATISEIELLMQDWLRRAGD
ncbi:uncharacterized protein LOC120359174 [Solenopsis invicta]|uniref:uncharacterized protein LOC120359174 n=1 Tax=Solenopsis invicta TaxID=13686 RepID=UPI00193E9D82|nr:uncharacterized protein LOC120359174 [Solenopsis invicta]